MNRTRCSGTPPYWTPGTLITFRWGDHTGPHFAERVPDRLGN